MSARAGGLLRLDRLDHGHPVFRELFRGRLMLAMTTPALHDLVAGLAWTLEAEIRRLRYLGPLRSYPPRHLAFSQHHDPNWFAGGGYTWDVVRTRDDVRRRVNVRFGDASRLKTPYEREVRDLLPAAAVAGELPAKLAKALHDLAAALLLRLQGEEGSEVADLAAEVAE